MICREYCYETPACQICEHPVPDAEILQKMERYSDPQGAEPISSFRFGFKEASVDAEARTLRTI